MSDSDDDYMSDTFLAKCADTRPGLVSRDVARKNKQEKKSLQLNEKHKTKPRRTLEAEKRTEGLEKALGSENKGFALMQKMGYRSGMSLGKTGTGRTEPVPINIHQGRQGVGQESEHKRKQAEITAMREMMARKRQKKDNMLQEDFRAQRSKQMAEKQSEKDLYKSQRVCEQLDEEQGLENPQEFFFWTPRRLEFLEQKKEKSEEDSDDDYAFTEQNELSDEEELNESYCTDLTIPEQLEMITTYLRTSYMYCVWCGAKYEDDQDLSKNCPGDTFEAHES